MIPEGVQSEVVKEEVVAPQDESWSDYLARLASEALEKADEVTQPLQDEAYDYYQTSGAQETVSGLTERYAPKVAGAYSDFKEALKDIAPSALPYVEKAEKEVARIYRDNEVEIEKALVILGGESLVNSAETFIQSEEGRLPVAFVLPVYFVPEEPVVPAIAEEPAPAAVVVADSEEKIELPVEGEEIFETVSYSYSFEPSNCGVSVAADECPAEEAVGAEIEEAEVSYDELESDLAVESSLASPESPASITSSEEAPLLDEPAEEASSLVTSSSTQAQTTEVSSSGESLNSNSSSSPAAASHAARVVPTGKGQDEMSGQPEVKTLSSDVSEDAALEEKGTIFNTEEGMGPELKKASHDFIKQEDLILADTGNITTAARASYRDVASPDLLVPVGTLVSASVSNEPPRAVRMMDPRFVPFTMSQATTAAAGNGGSAFHDAEESILAARDLNDPLDNVGGSGEKDSGTGDGRGEEDARTAQAIAFHMEDIEPHKEGPFRLPDDFEDVIAPATWESGSVELADVYV